MTFYFLTFCQEFLSLNCDFEASGLILIIRDPSDVCITEEEKNIIIIIITDISMWLMFPPAVTEALVYSSVTFYRNSSADGTDGDGGVFLCLLYNGLVHFH